MTGPDYDLKKIYKDGIIAVLVPSLAFLIAYFTNSILILDYVHVLLGALWTGVDIFLGLIFSSVIKTINKATKINIARGMIPMTLFFIPTVSIVVPAAGYVLATREGIFSFTSNIFIAIIIIGILLVMTGFLTIVPVTWKFSKELSKENPDKEKISKSINIISKGAFIQMFFQMAIISLMAYIVVFP